MGTRFFGRGFTGCGKTQNAVILSEAKNLSLFFFLYLNRREILRFAQNDKTKHFFRSLFSVIFRIFRKFNGPSGSISEWAVFFSRNLSMDYVAKRSCVNIGSRRLRVR